MTALNLKQSFRNLQRNKIYSFINLAGLGVSSAFILLVAVYVRHALRMDRYSDTLKNIYRIETNDLWDKIDTSKKIGVFDWVTKDAEVQNQLVTPLVLGEDLKRNLPEIKQFCRIQNEFEPVILTGDKRFKEEENQVAFVDKNFFSFFNLPLLSVKEENAFPDIHSVVLVKGQQKNILQTRIL